MKLILSQLNIAQIEQAFHEKTNRCVLYCDFNVANIIYDKNLNFPSSFIIYPDSSLMHFTLKWFDKIDTNRIVSTDLQEQVLNMADSNKLNIYLFGDQDEILKRTKKNIKFNYPNISIVGCTNGYNFQNADLITNIKKTKPDILLVGLGAGRQEEWLVQNYNQLNSIIAISVGGYFRFLSGVKKRAPIILRKLKLEWFYRLITEFEIVWKKYSIDAIKFIYRVYSKKIEFIYDSR